MFFFLLLFFFVVVVVVVFFLSYLQYLFNFIYFFVCLFKRLLKGNKYFERIKHTFEN